MNGLKGLTYEEGLKALKLPSKKFTPDHQDTIQPNRPGSSSTVQVLQNVRTKKITPWTVSSNRKNPRKEQQLCLQGFQVLIVPFVSSVRMYGSVHLKKNYSTSLFILFVLKYGIFGKPIPRSLNSYTLKGGQIRNKLVTNRLLGSNGAGFGDVIYNS